MARRPDQPDPNTTAFHHAWNVIGSNHIFTPMTDSGCTYAGATARFTEGGLPGIAQVDADGVIRVNRHRRLEREEWEWVIAHGLLHLGFGHTAPGALPDDAARAAACVVVSRFQREVKLGREPQPLPDPLPSGDETALAERWRRSGVPAEMAGCGTAAPDVIAVRDDCAPGRGRGVDWSQRFAAGLTEAATAGIEVAGGARRWADGSGPHRTAYELAFSWFLQHYPLLGGIAAGFTLVDDVELARSEGIAIAAVSAGAGEIYVNPVRNLSEREWRFVLAHEMLHAALRHGDRVGHRDPYLWNVACDFVINGWLVEMGVGVMPDGLLHDPELTGANASAEAVYDRIAGDLRRMRKLATLRGKGVGDLLGEPLPWSGRRGGGLDLDEFCRRALLTGHAYHVSSGRGLLPAGLEEEIRVLEQPPLPWDVRLARWFDEHVPVVEPRRSYARPSRRQASTPDIPRPGRHRPEEIVPRATFGVVVDTSGSMSPQLMGKALGAIASYATARDVPAARVVFCDATAYDAGYLPVEEIAGRVRVHGRGGTVLQPAIGLLERAGDFPADGPILVITDGHCDVLRIRRAHAYLMPRGARLPFTPRGPVFSLR
ncbi:vWA domain-containing protein [Actinoplanes sp. HUAS TT8]|uniref:vWA domain-containing protein n=1 Tax=Actinoplanes sp. HUAS TT8 TaxID=3447453 RepID=UPI003F51C033